MGERRTIKQVLADVAGDPGAAAAHLLVERSEKRARKTLLKALERIVMSEVRLGPNGLALEHAIQALAVGPEHAALVAACRSLAAQVDGTGFDDHAWREYRLSLKALMEATADGGSDAFAEWIAGMRTEMGDPAHT